MVAGKKIEFIVKDVGGINPPLGQAAVAGTRRARQCRHSRRLCADAERLCRRRRVEGGQQVHGGDERGDLRDHAEVARHDPHVDDAAAIRRHVRHMGGDQGRHQVVLHDGVRLRPRARCRAVVHQGVPGGRRQDLRLGAFPGGQSGLSQPSCSAPRTSIRSASSSSCPAARSRRRSPRRWPSAASIPRRSRFSAPAN